MKNLTRIHSFFFCLTFLFMGKALLSQNFIQEKVKLHIDKELYMAGETLWGKAYLTDAVFERPSELSKVVFVEFWDDRGNLILQQKILLEQGSGDFSLAIPPDQDNGYYQIRAYSKWMANASSQEFASYTFRIFNPAQPIPLREESEVSQTMAHQVSLFPEGGQLIHSLNSRVGVKIQDASGQPVTAIGRIEHEGSIVAVFQSNEQGLSEFPFTPDSTKSYGLRILQDGDSSKLFDFPKIFPAGVSLKVSQSSSSLGVQVQAYNLSKTRFLLKVYKGGYELQSRELDLGSGSDDLSFLTRDIPPGACMLQVQNDQGEIFAWRQVWIGSKEELKLQISLSKPQASTREKIRIDLQAFDGRGNAGMADLALSIAKKIPTEDRSQRKVSDWTDDLNMLTRGASLSPNGNNDYVYPELFGITVSGHIKGFNPDQDSPARLILSLPGKQAYMRTMKTNKEGRFNFVLSPVYGVRELGLLAVNEEGTPLDVEMDPVFYGDTPYPAPQKLRFSQEELKYLKELSINNQLRFAYQDTFPVYTDPVIPTLKPFYGYADKEYILDEYTRFDTEETFNEIVYSVALRKKKGDFYFRVYNEVAELLMKPPPLVLFDGIPLIDANSLIKLNSKLIEKIEVVSSVYYQDDFPLYGIVNVTSFKGDASILELPKEYLRRPYTFLAPTRSFTKAFPAQPHLKRIPDQRILLHWEPKIMTDEQGKAFVEFYTSDVPGEYEIKVSGISPEGLWIEQTEDFKVLGAQER